MNIKVFKVGTRKIDYYILTCFLLSIYIYIDIYIQVPLKTVSSISKSVWPTSDSSSSSTSDWSKGGTMLMSTPAPVSESADVCRVDSSLGAWVFGLAPRSCIGPVKIMTCINTCLSNCFKFSNMLMSHVENILINNTLSFLTDCGKYELVITVLPPWHKVPYL